MKRKILYHPFFIKLFNWEYWPFSVVYGPLSLYWIWLCIRSRSFFFFSASNPSIKNGGFLMESKWSIYKLLPRQYYPETLFFSADSKPSFVIDWINRFHINYPLIGKPDIGMKGMAVRKLDTEEQLIDYVKHSKVDFLIQEYVPFKNEAGIFYYRYPGEAKGHISGIVSKEFVTVTGDGKSTIRELLMKEKRYILQLPALKKMYGNELDRVLPAWREFVLVPYGNHVRGSKFTDDSRLIDEKLTATIDAICAKINGFYYGRLDVRYKTWEELREGKNFSIIEVNGAGSEPTHIYDPKHSIFFAWKEIIRHWNILAKISRINHQRKIPYMNIKSGLSMLRQNKEYIRIVLEKGEPKIALA